ncbi:hypothetical protein [Aurantibacillus circumpalustris]|uniref:hypothetical protein n=1 Tax=Aurantibacillus circumpalustris TaxID=3036359 RepID=UPI00295B6688|nr:hypothetical protein [Aurantibacillus circumpalustris]
MNKSSKIFIIVSGVYLFALTFILLTQPQSGYTATVGQVLMYYALYFPLWAVIAGTIFIATKHSDKSWNQQLFGQRTLFWSIIISIVIGFALNSDYQRQSGCFIEYELMFSPTKFIFSISSLLLLSSGYYFSYKKIGTSLLIIEFILWTFKTLYFDGSLDLFFPGYFTMVCWTLRVALIYKALNRHADASVLDTKTTR